MKLLNAGIKREAWIDNARMFAMSCIVIAHINSAMRTPCSLGFTYWIVSFNMPLFVILSSYLSYRNLSVIIIKKDVLRSFEKYSFRIALPTLFASAVLGSLSYIRASVMGISVTPISLLLMGGLVLYWFLLSSKRYSLVLVPISLIFIPLLLWYSGYWFMKMLLVLTICAALISFVNHKIGRSGGLFFYPTLLYIILV